MAKIYLVRHAESLANTEGIYQGQTYDTDLSARGKSQAQALAQCFERISLLRVVASPLKRTLQTATTVALNKHLPVHIEPQIIETNHGDWEGKHKDVIKKTWPWIYRKWTRFPSATKFPQGEHFLETQKRVVKWWQIFCQNISSDTLVVSHDNIIRIIVARILNRKLNKIWKFHLQPTAITEVSVAKDKITLVSLGDSKHLGGLDVDLSMHAL
ncbi:MAG: histidine phosphatase family protein [Candidatus Gottesmanbacteria bacterium]|nr:histidine phosphatase family protein [Candidatus Gottesmanbacteria bacterium]